MVLHYIKEVSWDLNFSQSSLMKAHESKVTIRLEEERYWLSVRKKSFTARTVEQQTQLSRKAVKSSSLNILKPVCIRLWTTNSNFKVCFALSRRSIVRLNNFQIYKSTDYLCNSMTQQLYLPLKPKEIKTLMRHFEHIIIIKFLHI